jgi:nitrogenase molybdenum-iron protein alpha/beta subunit
MANKLSDANLIRLKQLVNDGVQVLQECEDLRTGLSETVKAIAEELEVKPAQLNKVIKIAHKSNLNQVEADFDEVKSMLDQLGRGI